MAHSNANAIIDPQLQYHDQRSGAGQRHGSHSNHYAHTHSHAQHLPLASSDPHQQHAGGAHHQLYASHPQLAGPHDDDADDGESAGEEGSHASPEDTGNAG